MRDLQPDQAEGAAVVTRRRLEAEWGSYGCRGPFFLSVLQPTPQ